MAKPTKKKSTPKKAAKKPPVGAKKPPMGKSVKKPVTAKPAPKAATPPSREQGGATPYAPKPIAGIGWPAFRYPLT
jgi:hypothetical protein